MNIRNYKHGEVALPNTQHVRLTHNDIVFYYAEGYDPNMDRDRNPGDRGA